MTWLAVNQLENNETCSFNLFAKDNMRITDLRLGLYKVGNPDGILTVKLKRNGLVVSVFYLELSKLNNEITKEYFYGMVKFDNTQENTTLNFNGMSDLEDVSINKKGEVVIYDFFFYRLEIEVELTGHTNDDNNSIALIKQNNLNYELGTKMPDNDVENSEQWYKSYAIELYGVKNV